MKKKKSLGQHFLTNEDVASQIADALHIESNDVVVEVGPGEGALTKWLLAKKCKQLILIEKDRRMPHFLTETLNIQGAVKIIEEDFLRIDFEQLFKGQTVKVIGNFPYNISSQIILKVLRNVEMVNDVVGMFQKEVAQRIASGPNSRKFGLLSVLVQLFYEVEYLFEVQPFNFDPPPKVDSAVIRLKKKEKLPKVNFDKMLQLVKICFAQRRKKLKNNLKTVLNIDLIPPHFLDRRAEQLSLTNYLELYEILNKEI